MNAEVFYITWDKPEQGSSERWGLWEGYCCDTQKPRDKTTETLRKLSTGHCVHWQKFTVVLRRHVFSRNSVSWLYNSIHNSIKFFHSHFLIRFSLHFFLTTEKHKHKLACLYETWMCLLLQRTLKMSSPPWQLFGHEGYLDTSKSILLCGYSAKLRHVQFYCEVFC